MTTPYLIYSQLEVSFPLQLQRESGGEGKVFPIGRTYLCLSANNRTSEQNNQ
jgi:hypothetical protein